MANVGLVLSGGGARAAYQVGALRGLSEVLGSKASPFKVIAGLSAGAINGASLASTADDFPKAVHELTETWLSLTPGDVYRTDMPKLARLGLRWFKDLSMGGSHSDKPINYLLDTTPLRELLSRRIDMTRIPKLVEDGALHGVAMSATNYLTGTIVSFFDAAPSVQSWVRRERMALRSTLTIDHVMASAAIPVFFPPVFLDNRPFGDGGVRMTTPISPAVQLGADRILTIGIRYGRSPEQTNALNREAQADTVSIAQIGGMLLNALFLDSLDNDFERLQRINRTINFIPENVRHQHPDALRYIPALALRPSQDLGKLAADEYKRFPAMLRHLLRGIGATGDAGWDLLSYLAFQPGYVGKLIALGYEDTLARRADIEAFFDEVAAPGSRFRAASE